MFAGITNVKKYACVPTGKEVICKINSIFKNKITYAKILTAVISDGRDYGWFLFSFSISSMFSKFSTEKKKKAVWFVLEAECNRLLKSEPLLPGKRICDEDAWNGLAFTLTLF